MSKKKIFVTSDIWFNRPIGKKIEETSNEYNEMIINNWNKTVSKKDIVYILGGLGISEMYHLLIKLNGEIHILNNFYTKDEKLFIKIIKHDIDSSIDKALKNKIIFEESQILSLPELDTILSYFPLNAWSGFETGTYHFYGLTNESDFSNNKISCKMEDWDYKPILITHIQESLTKFKTNC